jgi:hypothetical protein
MHKGWKMKKETLNIATIIAMILALIAIASLSIWMIGRTSADGFNPEKHDCTMTCEKRVNMQIPPKMGEYPRQDELCGDSWSDFCPDCCLYWEDKESLTPCGQGDEDYNWINSCPDYNCICLMPKNQSLCGPVMELCRNQTYKLEGEKMCMKKVSWYGR